MEELWALWVVLIGCTVLLLAFVVGRASYPTPKTVPCFKCSCLLEVKHAKTVTIVDDYTMEKLYCRRCAPGYTRKVRTWLAYGERRDWVYYVPLHPPQRFKEVNEDGSEKKHAK